MVRVLERAGLAVAAVALVLVSADAVEAQSSGEINNTARAGLILRLSNLSDIGPDRGALHVPRLDFGFRIRSRTGHIGFDLGFGVGVGAYRLEVDRMVGYAEMGPFMDMRVYFNPRSRAQLFALTGVGISLGGPFVHAATPPGEELSSEECPSLSQLEASLGFGTEIRLTHGAVSFMVRMVRRRAIGELEYISSSLNVDDETSRTLWGLRAGVQITAYFDSE